MGRSLAEGQWPAAVAPEGRNLAAVASAASRCPCCGAVVRPVVRRRPSLALVYWWMDEARMAAGFPPVHRAGGPAPVAGATSITEEG